MTDSNSVLEYKCPCCGAALVFGELGQKMKCEHCDNVFEMEAVTAYNESLEPKAADNFRLEETSAGHWSEDEQEEVCTFTCPACGGVLMTDGNTAATFCPYCENPTILPGRLSGSIRPEGVIPFQTTREDARKAFLSLCKGKPLLPKFFTQEQRVEKITGMYVPFWLYECGTGFEGTYKATRVHHWVDSKYSYTRTEHFLLTRGASAEFADIPMDASTKMDNAIMESIEPYDYSKMIDFDTAYLSGFLADKYDVEAEIGQERVKQRVSATMDEMIRPTLMSYATAVPTSKTLQMRHGKAKYVLLPVWMLHTKYKDKTYVFAMNGQTGKMTGTFPICPKRSAAWFASVCAAATVVVTLLQMLFS